MLRPNQNPNWFGGLRVLLAASALLLSLSATEPLHGDNERPVGGCEWEIVPSVSPAFDALYGVTALSRNDVWAVGTSQRHSSPVQPLIEHWDGANWSAVDSPTLPGPAGLFEVDAVSPKDVWAIGQFNPNSQLGTLIEHWDGYEWTIVPSPHPGSINGLPQAEVIDVDALSPNNVWAVGVSIGPTRTESFVMNWDGAVWSLVPTPRLERSSGFSSILALAPTDVWAAGFVTDPIYGNRESLVEHWDGINWTVVPTPTLPQEFSAIGRLSAVSPRDIWASGLYRTPEGGYQPYFEHWDGNTWTIVPAPSKGFFAQLSPVAVGPNNVWAVGSSAAYSNYQSGSTLIEHWDGTSWSIVPSLNSGAPNSALLGGAAASTEDIWAVGGDFTQGSPLSSAKTLIEHCTSIRGLKQPS